MSRLFYCRFVQNFVNSFTNILACLRPEQGRAVIFFLPWAVTLFRENFLTAPPPFSHSRAVRI